MMLKIIALCAFVQFSYALFGGGASGERIVHLRKLGFDEDHQTMSHELVVPWIRPFKPGYCSSWEWHTDKRYREQRMAVCEELSGGKCEIKCLAKIVLTKSSYTK